MVACGAGGRAPTLTLCHDALLEDSDDPGQVAIVVFFSLKFIPVVLRTFFVGLTFSKGIFTNIIKNLLNSTGIFTPGSGSSNSNKCGPGSETLRFFYMIDGLAGELEHRQAEPEVQGERASLLPLQHHLHGRRHGRRRRPGQQHK